MDRYFQQTLHEKGLSLSTRVLFFLLLFWKLLNSSCSSCKGDTSVFVISCLFVLFAYIFELSSFLSRYSTIL
jgi:F0F1-type ATP synthase assembly protein I